MTDLRKAAQQALEALEWAWGGEPLTGKEMVAIAALRAALAEPEQEPVRLQCTTCGTVYADGVPPQVPEQEPQTTHWEGCEAVHPECRKPEQEPVAWIQKTAVDWLTTTSSNAYIITTVMKNTNDEAYVPLYTAPTPRKPLTEGEMPTLFVGGLALNSEATTEIVRAVEKAHGIGEQHE